MSKVLTLPKRNVSNSNQMSQNLTRGTLRFTCPKCNHCNNFETGETIIKVIEFFCKCGVGFKVKNPGFTPSED